MKAQRIEDEAGDALGNGRRNRALALFMHLGTVIDAHQNGDGDVPSLLEQARDMARELLEDSLALVDDRYVRREDPEQDR